MMLAHLEATRAAMLVVLEDRDRETTVIGDVHHREDRMPTAPRLGKCVNSVDKSTASGNANGGSPCPSQTVRLHGKGCRHGGKTRGVGIEIVDPVAIDPINHQINARVSFRLIFVGSLALAHNPI